MVKKKNFNFESGLEDNFLALAVVILSGTLTLLALYSGVESDRAKTALAVGSNGMSGVIGFIGGKSRRKENPPQSSTTNNQTTGR